MLLMQSNDTVELLKECSSGVRMGVDSINEVIDKAQSQRLRDVLTRAREEHERLGNEADCLLTRYGDDAKQPNPVAKGMSWLKTNVKMAVDDSDQTIADLMTEGCGMGIKSLNRYLNQYTTAGDEARGLARKLIRTEENLVEDLRRFL